MERALVLYVKSPVAGLVKSRLTIGKGGLSSEEAALFYKALLLDILSLFYNLSFSYNYRCFVCPKDSSFPNAIDLPFSLDILEDRGGGDLGLSMYYSIERLILRGYSAVCIVGTDIPFFTIDLLMRSFSLLEDRDLVFGPSLDGGTYLIGSSGTHSIFSDMEWGKGSDFSILCERASDLGLNYSSLDSLMDIDNIGDFIKLKGLMLRDSEAFSRRLPRTYSFLLGFI